MDFIDLRSDTVTRPTDAMRDYMLSAEVGDDVFSEDPTVNRLEEKLASLFGKEAALFCSSGTMANQIAIKAHCRPGDQVICSWAAHVYHYEGGGMAMNSGVTAKLLDGERGMFTVEDVRKAISPNDVHFPTSRLVCIEDSVNKGGGALWDIQEIEKIQALCSERDLSLHLDGARLFNRLVAKKDKPKSYAQYFDSISICLSKGLGAPVGSVLLGSTGFIKRARRYRKAFGGGMRQAGIIAAGGIYALDNHVDRLQLDHDHAQRIAASLLTNDLVKSTLPIESNIVIFQLNEASHLQKFLSALEENKILALATGNDTIRFVLHLDVSKEAAQRVAEVCRELRI